MASLQARLAALIAAIKADLGAVGSRVTTLEANGGGGTPPQIDAFTANGTWTKPAGAVLCQSIAIGGGGGGGGTDSLNNSGAGGAGGAGLVVVVTYF